MILFNTKVCLTTNKCYICAMIIESVTFNYHIINCYILINDIERIKGFS